MRSGASGSGSGSGRAEPVGDSVSKKLAEGIAKELDAHKEDNQDFPVIHTLPSKIVADP